MPDQPSSQDQSGITPAGPGGSATPGGDAEPDTPADQPSDAAEPDDAAEPSDTSDSEGSPGSTPESPFEPRANDSKRGNWALLNLVAMLLTVYLALPLGALKAKFKRLPIIRSIASKLAAAPEGSGIAPEEAAGATQLVKRLTAKFRTGLALEAAIALASVIVFVAVTDFRQPLVIVNRHTPLFLALLAACLAVEVTLIRFCSAKEQQKEEASAE